MVRRRRAHTDRLRQRRCTPAGRGRVPTSACRPTWSAARYTCCHVGEESYQGGGHPARDVQFVIGGQPRVDGGVVADFPVGILRPNGRPPAQVAHLGPEALRPTPSEHGRLDQHGVIGGPVGLGPAMLAAMRNVHEQRSLAGEEMADARCSSTPPPRCPAPTSASGPPLGPDRLKQACAAVPTGVSVITTAGRDGPSGD